MERAVVPSAFTVSSRNTDIDISRIYKKFGKDELQSHQFSPVLTQPPRANFARAGAREVQA